MLDALQRLHASAPSPAAALPLPLLLRLQDTGRIQLADDEVSALARQMRREARHNAPLVHGMLLDCAVQLASKAPVYALLVGAWAQRRWEGAAGKGWQCWQAGKRARCSGSLERCRCIGGVS